MEFSFGKYCKSSTESHPIALANNCCLGTLNNKVDNDANGKMDRHYFDANVTVLDIDCVEKHASMSENRPKKKSVDFTFAITQSLIDKRMVLVELKLNYQNSLRNLKEKDLEEKFDHSLLLLASSHAVYEHYFIVIMPEFKEQARRRIFSFNGKSNDKFKTVDLEELKANFF